MKIILYGRGIKATQSAMLKAAIDTAEELLGDIRSAQIMPFDTGDMQDKQTHTEVSKVGNEIHACIIVDSPQARRLYYHPEYRFQTVHNKNARGLYFEPWMAGGNRGAFAQETYARRLQERMKK